MRIINRDENAISLEPTMDRNALWLTIHGKTREENRMALLSLDEARVLADGLEFLIHELEQESHGPIIH